MRKDKIWALLGTGAFMIGFFLCFWVARTEALIAFCLMLGFISNIWLSASLEERIDQLKPQERTK